MIPSIYRFIELMDVLFREDVYSVICEYDEESSKVYVYLYCSEWEFRESVPQREKTEVDTDRFFSIFSNMIGKKIHRGKKNRNIYDEASHRKIIWMRMYLPSGKVQIDYEDSSEFIDFSDEIVDYLRKSFYLEE